MAPELVFGEYGRLDELKLAGTCPFSSHGTSGRGTFSGIFGRDTTDDAFAKGLDGISGRVTTTFPTIAWTSSGDPFSSTSSFSGSNDGRAILIPPA